MHIKRRRRLSYSLITAIILAGCSSSDEHIQLDNGWAEPAWMTQARMDAEAYTAAMMGCLAGYGVQGVRAMGGGVVIAGSADPQGGDSEIASQIRADALDSCSEQIPFPDMWFSPRDSQAYQRVADTRECIVSLGFDIPELPALDVWMEDTHPLPPHEQLPSDLSDDELLAVFTACPQPGSVSIVTRVHADDLADILSGN